MDNPRARVDQCRNKCIPRARLYGLALALPTSLGSFQLGAIVMERLVVPAHLPASSAELFQLARDWWRDDDARLLPGEEGGRTVFVVDFRDGCRYFGYTRGSVFNRVASLLCELEGSGANPFAVQHAARIPYVVRCVATRLSESQARQLRRLLVSESPGRLTQVGGAVARSVSCWLTEETPEEVPENISMPFHALPDLGRLSTETWGFQI